MNVREEFSAAHTIHNLNVSLGPGAVASPLPLLLADLDGLLHAEWTAVDPQTGRVASPRAKAAPAGAVMSGAGGAATAGEMITMLHEGRPVEAAANAGVDVLETKVMNRVPALVPLAVMASTIDAYDAVSALVEN
jgi:hypothetical protein